MRVVIVTTYPEHGSMNIGDQLISTSLHDILKTVCDVKVKTIWRASSWLDVKDDVMAADHVFFACLAMRPRMHEVEYPFLSEVVKSGVPFSVISAGTDLPVWGGGDIFSTFSKKTLDLLLDVNEKAVRFTTRGVLSQAFCENNGLGKASLDGDVAFYSQGDISFEVGKKIRKVVISDPHRAGAYLGPFVELYRGVTRIFEDAQIVVALHGKNKIIEAWCKENDALYERIYEDRYGGLDLYDSADLHVGFRVHGHVSALKRGVYSYLLEQDGRGCDYGLTIDRKISVPNYLLYKERPSRSSRAFALMTGRKPEGNVASVAPALELLSMIRSDARQGFVRFNGLEEQIKSFGDRCARTVAECFA